MDGGSGLQWHLAAPQIEVRESGEPKQANYGLRNPTVGRSIKEWDSGWRFWRVVTLIFNLPPPRLTPSLLS